MKDRASLQRRRSPPWHSSARPLHCRSETRSTPAGSPQPFRPQRVLDQGLHQPAPAIFRQRGDMLDQPVALAALNPAIRRIGATPEDRRAPTGRARLVATSSIAARTAARVPDAGKAHSEAAGFPSTSAMMNCETCHHEDACAVAIRSTKSRHCGSSQPSAMSNQPRGSGPRCEARILRAMKLASSARAGRIAGSDRPAAIRRSSARRGIRLRSSPSPRPA